jgi:uncharacterized protein
MSCPIASNMLHERLPAMSLLCGLVLAATTLARPADPAAYAPFPAPDSGYVTDHAKVLSPAQQEEIERWLWQVESRTGVEMCVVTVSSMADYAGTPNQNIESFAKALFNRWGVGNRPRNDGVLLLISIADRKARIQLGAGYSARDADAQRIMDKVILPRFRNGDYPGGIREGARALMLEFAHVRIGWNWPLIAGMAGIPVLALVAVSLFRNGKRGWGWVCVGLIAILILAVIFLLREAARHLPDSDSSSWDAGGFGGGFGGGFSGGGGATGSW